MKNFKRNLNKPWSKDSKTDVLHMNQGDFYGSEESHICQTQGEVQITFNDAVLKSVPVLRDEVIDFAVMEVSQLRQF